MKRDSENSLAVKMNKQACDDSFTYMKNNMKDIVIFHNNNAHQIYQLAIDLISIDGEYLEFGVYRGGTAIKIAKLIEPKVLHGFDSFYGVPENWRGNIKGFLNNHGKVPKLPKNVTIHKGLFKDTLQDIKLPKPIAFLHIDCDIYSSTKTVFVNLAKDIVKGTVIIFDEYFNYTNWEKHEFKAFQEFVKENDIEYEYKAVSGTGKVCLVITKKGNDAL